MRELIKFYFDEIKRGDLLGDNTIHFLFNGRIYSHFSDDLIKDIDIFGNEGSMLILVNDLDDKIQLVFHPFFD